MGARPLLLRLFDGVVGVEMPNIEILCCRAGFWSYIR